MTAFDPFEQALAELAASAWPRRQTTRHIYRVRGYSSDGEIRWSRMFNRRTDAERWYRTELDWFPKVTLEVTDVDFTEVEVRP